MSFIVLIIISLSIVGCLPQNSQVESNQLAETKSNEFGALQIDHIVHLVKDIDIANDTYASKGFTIKKGRLHNNGLINSHIKFKNKTSIELMSIVGEPTDDISKNYFELLKDGEGGVFISFSGAEISTIERKLDDLQITYHATIGANWNYITFPETSSLAHFFFIEYKLKVNDSTNILTHSSKSDKITKVWVEGDNVVRYFLNGLGFKSGGMINDVEIGQGERFLTNSGEIVVIPNKILDKRPRIKLISVGNDIDSELLKIKL